VDEEFYPSITGIEWAAKGEEYVEYLAKKYQTKEEDLKVLQNGSILT